MSANVGLSTPRGSGTSGYVQRNLSHLKPRDQHQSGQGADDFQKYKQRKPDPGILEHERKREIEVKVFELRDKLEEEGVGEDEIDEQVDAYRRKLELEGARKDPDARGLKSHQVHELAKAKTEETERVRRAFGIGKDYEEGGHWRKQEQRKREAEKQAVEQDDGESEERERRKSIEQDRRRSKYRDRDGERYEDRRSSRSPARDDSD